MPQQPGTGNLLIAARPTISVDGQSNPALEQGLTNLLISENTAGLYQCEATFGNWGEHNGRIDFLYFDRQTLDFGKPFRVSINNDVLFDGLITGLEAHFGEARPPEIVVLAEDRFQALRMTRRTRSFHDITDSQLFNQLANDHGLTPQIDVTGPTHKVLTQLNQSDLAFLRERARAIDAELWMDNSTLHVKSHAQRTGSAVELTHGQNLHQFTALADLAHQRSSVTVTGWDVADKTAIKYEASEPAIRSELNGSTSGVSILNEKLGQRAEILAHTVPFNNEEAQAFAEAYFKMIARRFVTGRGIAEASAQLRVGATVDIKNVGPLFSGKYYLSEVRQLFDMVQGLRTEFTAERPGLGNP